MSKTTCKVTMAGDKKRRSIGTIEIDSSQINRWGGITTEARREVAAKFGKGFYWVYPQST